MMKKKYITVSLIAFALAAGGYFFFEAKNHTVKADSVKIAVIYAQRIKKQAIPYQKFEEFFEKEHEKIYKEFLEKEKVLKEEFQDLKNDKKNKKEVIEKKALFQEKANALSNSLQSKKEEFLQNVHVIETKLQEGLKNCIEKTIKKYGFNLVLNAELEEKTMVFYADQKFDITDEVISELDKLPPQH
jgi:Skp family chaperone for outer membrane proteins